jgi:hypothetical protein
MDNKIDISQTLRIYKIVEIKINAISMIKI